MSKARWKAQLDELGKELLQANADRRLDLHLQILTAAEHLCLDSDAAFSADAMISSLMFHDVMLGCEVLGEDQQMVHVSGVLEDYSQEKGALSTYITKRLQASKGKKALEQRIDTLGRELPRCSRRKRKELQSAIIAIAEFLYMGDSHTVVENIMISEQAFDMVMLGHEITRSDASGEHEVHVPGILEDYDPQKGRLSHYISLMLRRKETDLYRYRYGRSKKGEENGEEKDEKKKLPTLVPLDSPVTGKDDTESGTVADLIPDMKTVEMVDAISDYSDPARILRRIEDKLDERYLEFASLIQSFASEKTASGKARNPVQAAYFRLIFTNDVINRIKKSELYLKFRHERDLLDNMETGYLDFVLRDVCRSFLAVFRSRTKNYREVLDEPGKDRRGRDRADMELTIPIGDLICASYTTRNWKKTTLNNAKRSLSENRAKYRAIIGVFDEEEFTMSL